MKGRNIVASSNEKAIRTVCSFCHNNCGLIAYVSNGVLRRVKGDPDHPANKGDICPKGAAAPKVVHSPHRLKHPLHRTNSGFRQVSWQEALDITATKLLEIREKYCGETLIRCNGAPVTRASWDAFAQLTAAYGSANHTGSGHVCHIPRDIAFGTVYGAMTWPDYKNTRCIIMWGSNPPDSRDYRGAHGRFTRLIPEAKSRGAKLIVIDPRRTNLANMADKWLTIEPGRDDALALSMLNVIIKEGLYDKEFVTQWTIGFEELAEHVERFTPEWAQSITKLHASDIREVATLYATTKPAIIMAGNGLDQYPNVIQTVRAIGILCAITGNLDVEGGNVFLSRPALSPLISQPTKIKRLSADRYPLYPWVPFPSLVDAILTGEPYTPKAMIVYHANPALINADSTKTRQALEKLELLVVCDIFMSATAEMADIILPEASEFEQHSFQNYASVEGGFVALKPKVIEPIGESRTAFEIEYELARKMGLNAAYPWTNNEEWVNYRLKASKITMDDLKKQQIIYTIPPLEHRKYLKHGFNTPSGKVEIYSQKLKDHGYPPLPEFKDLDASLTAETASPGNYPLIGTTRRPGVYVHTRFRNIPALQKLEPEPLARLHPKEAQSRKIVDGDLVAVQSPNGMIKIKAKVTDEVSPGVVIIDFGWGNPGDQEPNVNILTSDKDRDPISCSTPNRRFRCQVTRV
jgi:anaerobic selenocysteine-containing dehydrogenase